MKAAGQEEHDQPTDPATAAQLAGMTADAVAAWEQVETGRFLPRRIKGSCKGRALG